MDELTAPDTETEVIELSASVIERYAQIHLKSEGEKLLLILPKANPNETSHDWTEMMGGLKYYLKKADRIGQRKLPSIC